MARSLARMTTAVNAVTVRFVAVLLLAACGYSKDGAKTPAPSAPTRVFLITLDTVRADELGAFGAARPLTPRLDELALAGTRFTRAMAPMPETIPSHVSMFTGRYPFAHGVENNFHSLSSDATTLAELLSAAGVATAAAFHVVPFGDSQITQGFAATGWEKGPTGAKVGKGIIDWLDKLPAAQPAFAWLHWYIAHDPYEPPEEFARRVVTHPYTGPLATDEAARGKLAKTPAEVPADYLVGLRERYEAEVAFLDATVGKFLDELRLRHALENALVVVVADHGEAFDPDAIGTHATVVRQSTLHVPLFLAGPGVPAARSVGDLVSLVDLFPTLLERFGVALPEVAGGIDGQSLWPLVRGETSEKTERTGVVFSSLPTLLDQQKAGQLPSRLVVFSDRFKLLVTDPEREPKVALFDLDRDPLEQQEVSRDHPDVVRALVPRIQQWVTKTKSARLAPGPISDSARELLKKLGYGE